ncbi:acyltransferase [Saccharospirillum sp. MSK14-1]|uniref:acyltransferase family protein n=1 Tax=Saccharospirillum sp. MSK14-1 TaxID=1897632 RepID=UPI000D3492FD|nr:acyltransferase [Saccharospirillum sp. MSK14-1]
MRLTGIDFLRVLAVLLVVLSHYGFSYLGGYGVPLLITLSAFLITKILMSSDSKYTFKKHFLRRFLRIAPAYYSFLFISIFLDWILDDTWKLEEILFAVTHTFNYWNIKYGHTSTVSHVWTLSILEQFFIASYFLIWPILKLKERFFWVTSSLIVLSAVAFRSIIYLSFNATETYVYNDFFCRIDQYLIGVMLGYFYVKHSDKWVSFNLFYTVSLLLTSILAITYSKSSVDFRYTLGFTLEAIASCLLLFTFTNISSKLKFLNGKVITSLAASSYSAYLFHTWTNSVAKDMYIIGSEAQAVLASVLPFIVGMIVFLTIEKYFLNIRKIVLKN